jgi:ATP-dependent RNA helicase DDX5/DBP2
MGKKGGKKSGRSGGKSGGRKKKLQKRLAGREGAAVPRSQDESEDGDEVDEEEAQEEESEEEEEQQVQPSRPAYNPFGSVTCAHAAPRQLGPELPPAQTLAKRRKVTIGEYRVLASVTLRQGPEMETAVVEMLEPGGQITALEQKTLPNGVVRIRCAQGWASLKPKLLERLDGEPEQSYVQRHDIEMRGCDGGLTPVERMADAPFADDLLARCAKAGYTAPTPVQAVGWPAILTGRDVVCVAKTGSGKTVAFLLPLITRLREATRGDGPGAVVLGPTRELVTQIGEQARLFCKGSATRCVCCYGGDGADIGQQLKDVGGGVDLLIATPGRLIALVGARPKLLAAAAMLVLDEADRMMDMGFEPQVRARSHYRFVPPLIRFIPDSLTNSVPLFLKRQCDRTPPQVRQLLAALPPQRQTLLFTATWPEHMRSVAAELLSQPIQVEVAAGSRAEGGLTSNSQVQQVVSIVEPERKLPKLLAMLKQWRQPESSAAAVPAKPLPKVLVFVNTKAAAHLVNVKLQQAGIASDCLHGDRDQRVRAREKESGGSGGSLEPLGLFLRTSIPFIWRILSAFLRA